MVDHILAEVDAAKLKDESWRKGPKITMQDILNERGVERITAEELRTGKSRESARNQSRNKQESKVMGFGKYRDELILDVWESNQNYIRWAVQKVNGFRTKAIAAGIEEGEL